MLEKIEKKVTEVPDKLKEQKEKIEKPEEEEKEKEEPHKDFGKMLYKIVFSGELGEYFNNSLKAAQENGSGIRISLRCDEGVPEIAALPWEYLHNGKEFLITRKSILISRLPSGAVKKKSEPLESMLRMLVIISGPDDPRVPPLNTKKEQEIILEAVDGLYREKKIKIDFTDDATFENIQDCLTENDYHIVHFTGHGIFDEKSERGYLLLETEKGKPRLIDNEKVAELFSERGIRLVVLSSCQTAKGSNRKSFSDLASVLSIRGIPAVVAMQYSILDKVATKFAHTFYRTIANGKPVDLALKEARIMIRNSEKSNGVDFATPVLYLSDKDCVLAGELKPEPSMFVSKPMMLKDLQVMKTGFVSRRKELRLIRKGFESDIKRAVIIYGFGGLGKTVLATRLVLEMNDYFEGFFGMKMTSKSRPEDILDRINNFVMRKGFFQLNEVINQPVSLEVKTSVLVDILNQVRFLVIFDNFEDCLNEDRDDIESPELKEFILHLLNNTINGTKFIITTRYDFDPLEGRLTGDFEHISLPELQFPQTNWLMDNYTELADLDMDIKMRIYDVIGGHPWTIGQFAVLASNQGVDDLLLELEPLQKKLIEFTLLDRSYSKLDAAARKLLLCASIYEEAVPVEALSWIVGDEKDASPSVGEPLQKLLQWGLISKEQEYEKTVYSEHTIVKDFARRKLEEDGLDEKELLIRAARYYEILGTQSRNLWEHLKARDYYYQAEEWESASKIVELTSDYLIRWGHIELAMNLLNESIKTTSGDTKTNSEYVLATVFQRLGDLDQALKMYKKVKSEYEERGKIRGVAGTLHMLGTIFQARGNYKEAFDTYDQSLKIKEKLGDKKGVAGTLYQIGIIHQNQGNYEEALEMYNQSLKTFEELGDKSSVPGILIQVGILHQNQGNYEEAVKKYEDSLKIEEELRNKGGTALALHQLGNVHYLRGNYEEAVKKYNLVLKIRGEIGDKKGIAETFGQLGLIHTDQGNYEEAVKKYSQALKKFEELEDKGGTARTLHAIGNTNYRQGNYEEAAKMYNQALKKFKELEDKEGIASTLGQLGKIHVEKEVYPLAIQAYLISFLIFKSINSPYVQLAERDLAELRNKMGEEEFDAQFEKLVNNHGA
ncbi:tetratricopeptide repeat protein [Methanosarcina sp. KYL-1]|uniref:tetratricopeptide repeat protein n=1 Tax=Methanosarcina sp. KYL-1 TaxID=2602068 RepID=UPI0021015C95|nr:tetratricopeptide repeat protein [Methanosarcina sp. KYL-1]